MPPPFVTPTYQHQHTNTNLCTRNNPTEHNGYRDAEFDALQTPTKLFILPQESYFPPNTSLGGQVTCVVPPSNIPSLQLNSNEYLRSIALVRLNHTSLVGCDRTKCLPLGVRFTRVGTMCVGGALVRGGSKAGNWELFLPGVRSLGLGGASCCALLDVSMLVLSLTFTMLVVICELRGGMVESWGGSWVLG
jgi:hypothetical protein